MHLRDLPTLMVAADQGNALWVPYLQQSWQQQQQRGQQDQHQSHKMQRARALFHASHSQRIRLNSKGSTQQPEVEVQHPEVLPAGSNTATSTPAHMTGIGRMQSPRPNSQPG